jgi:hypothetical protein
MRENIFHEPNVYAALFCQKQDDDLLYLYVSSEASEGCFKAYSNPVPQS